MQKAGHAMVIGGSMGGILAARVLADHFEKVTLIERDLRIPAPGFRRGVPQGRHAHALLLRGLHTMVRLFPEAQRALLDAGAQLVNMGRDVRWFHFGVWKRRYASRLNGLSASRPLIEWTLGEHLRRLPNVCWMDGWSVEGLLFDRGTVVGVRARPRGKPGTERALNADFVIDATGRGSQTPAQLAAVGFERPPETAVRIDVGYATRIYRAPQTPRDWQMLYVMSQPPAKRGALIMPIEPDQDGPRWMVTQVGMHGDHPPADERGFLEFARSLPAPDLYEALMRAEPLGEAMRYGYIAAQRRHYEKLSRFPDGFLVIGDALCSFNPVYGQGMSTAAMYADVLDASLRESAEHDHAPLWRRFFARAARVAEMPWSLATGEDFRFSETVGKRSAALRLLHWYTARVQSACGHDALIAERFYEVMHLLRPPTALFRPDVIWRLIRPHLPGARSPGPADHGAGNPSLTLSNPIHVQTLPAADGRTHARRRSDAQMSFQEAPTRPSGAKR